MKCFTSYFPPIKCFDSGNLSISWSLFPIHVRQPSSHIKLINSLNPNSLTNLPIEDGMFHLFQMFEILVWLIKQLTEQPNLQYINHMLNYIILKLYIKHNIHEFWIFIISFSLCDSGISGFKSTIYKYPRPVNRFESGPESTLERLRWATLDLCIT